MKMYYNGCFFTKNPSQALSGKVKKTNFKNNNINNNYGNKKTTQNIQ